VALRKNCHWTNGAGKKIGPGKVGYLCAKKVETLVFTSYTTKNCIIDLNIKPKTIKFLKENIGDSFYDLRLGKAVLPKYKT
jgi:hypothetical protein